MSKLAEKTEINSRANLLAQPAFFAQRFVYEQLVFAEMVGGDADARLVAINRESRVYYCSCPFRPKPCVHALAFGVLLAQENEDSFTPVAELPEPVKALLAGLPAARRYSPAGSENRAAAREQRRFERLERAAGGFEDLETWLLDTIRRGLATVVSEDPRWWDNIAVRMADASMPGLSRTLRLLGQIPASNPDWAEKTAAVLGECYLAARAFRKRSSLPENLPYDLQNFVGIATKKEEVVAAQLLEKDFWAVVGQVEEPLEDKLAVRRSWLMAGNSGRFALLLDFAFGGGGFSPGFEPGSIQQGTLSFYPSAFLQRALPLDDLKEIPKKVEKLQGFEDFDTFAGDYAATLARQPWLQYFPAVFNHARVLRRGNGFFISDVPERSLQLRIPEKNGWRLLALGGGHPLTLFGEWDGAVFRPLSAVADGRFVTNISA